MAFLDFTEQNASGDLTSPLAFVSRAECLDIFGYRTDGDRLSSRASVPLH
ncbi:hypothetical protein CKA32_004762 [Geitlerinema sp. FC II]|nr:hypothetical protein CKA32_004762 [Geitlerinema sp. FC II]